MLPFFRRRNENADAPAYAENSRSARAGLLWKQGGRLLQLGKTARAIDAMRDAFELEPSRIEGRLNLGAALFLSGEAEEALSHLRYVLAFEPQNTMALLNLAACYDALGRLDESIEMLEQLVADRPEWKDAHYNLAVAYLKKHDYDKATEALRTELSINPQHSLAQSLLDKMHTRLPEPGENLFAKERETEENARRERDAQPPNQTPDS
jgi:tetratricopeptide (TPR) repeat protein